MGRGTVGAECQARKSPSIGTATCTIYSGYTKTAHNAALLVGA